MEIKGNLRWEWQKNFSLYNDKGETTPYIPTYTVTQVDGGGVWADHFHDGPSIAYVGHRIFILGGWNGTDTPAATDLIRYSDDEGDTWTDWITVLPYNTHSMVCIQSQDGWWYLIGGDGDCTSTERKTVHRTKDFVTFELRTSNAEFGNAPGGDRMLMGGVALDGGRICIMGGQHPSTFVGYDDIWVSNDGGITWTREQSGIVVAGNHFLGQNIDKCTIRRDDRVYVIGGGVYDSNPANRTWTAKCYVASIYDLSTWVRIDDSPLGNRQYAYCALWDGMIWQTNGVDNTSTNQYGTVYLDKNDTWHDLHVTYRGTLPGRMSISHAAPMYGIGGAMYRIGGNDENQAWKVTRSIKYFPEAAVPFYGDFALGEVALGGKYKFGVNCEDGNITSGHVMDVRGGSGRIENDNFVAFTVSTSTVSNNATGIKLYGGWNPVYLFSGGSSGALQKRTGIYLNSNNVPFTIFDTSENTMIGPGNTSAALKADNGYALQVVYGGIYGEGDSRLQKVSANETGTGWDFTKIGQTGNANGLVLNTAELGHLNFYGYDGNGGGTLSKSAYMIVNTTEDWDASGHGSKMRFYTTPNNSTTNTLALTIDQDQAATFTNTIKTADPGSGQGAWKLGDIVTVTTALDTTGYIEVEINGVTYMLALAVLV